MQLAEFETVLRRQGRSEKTVKAYLRFCHGFGKWLAATAGEDAVPKQALADEYLAYCRRRYRAATVHNIRQALAAWSKTFQPPGWWRNGPTAPSLPAELAPFMQWLEEKGKTPSTALAYARNVHRFHRWWERKETRPFSIDRWASWDVTAYHQHLQASGAKPATVNVHLAALSLYAKWAIETGRITANPVTEVGRLMLPGELGTPKWLSPLYEGRLTRELLARTQQQYAQPGAARKAQRDFALCLTMLDAGLRVSEVSQLRKQDLVNLQTPNEARVVVHFSKWGRSRNVPMTRRLIQALQKWLNQRGNVLSDYVFLSERNENMTSRAIQHRLAMWRQWAALPDWVTSHCLRHTFGHRLASQGESLDKIALLLGHMTKNGHPNLNMVAIYIRPSEQELREAIDRQGL